MCLLFSLTRGRSLNRAFAHNKHVCTLPWIVKIACGCAGSQRGEEGHKQRAQKGGGGFRDSECVPGSVGVDGDGRKLRYMDTIVPKNDEEAEDLVVRVQHEREEEAKDRESWRVVRRA